MEKVREKKKRVPLEKMERRIASTLKCLRYEEIVQNYQYPERLTS